MIRTILDSLSDTLWRTSRPDFAVARARATGAAACLACLCAQVATAQDVAPEPEAPRYTIELIVFTYSARDATGNEIFVPDKPKLVPDADDVPPEDGSGPVFSDLPLSGMEPSPVAGEPADTDSEERPERQRIELRVHEPDEHSMRDIYSTLERLGAYEPILHAAWTQTTPPRDLSPAVHLRALGNLPAGLDGSVTLYLGRYLHMVVDLALDAEPRQPSMTATDRLIAYGDEPEYGEEEVPGSFGDLPGGPVRYRIVEDRIMRTGDLRYFDHPRFGVIAKVTKPAGDRDGDGTDPAGTTP